jgi:hypothetical protein
MLLEPCQRCGALLWRCSTAAAVAVADVLVPLWQGLAAPGYDYTFLNTLVRPGAELAAWLAVWLSLHLI